MRRANERGAAAVEFGLILPVLLLLVGGIIDFGIMYNRQIVLTNAARDGVRQVAANSSNGWTQTQIQNRIAAAASPLTVGTYTLERSTDNGSTFSATTNWYCQTSGDVMRVTISPSPAYDYTILKFVPGLPKPVIQGKATMTCA